MSRDLPGPHWSPAWSPEHTEEWAESSFCSDWSSHFHSNAQEYAVARQWTPTADSSNEQTGKGGNFIGVRILTRLQALLLCKLQYTKLFMKELKNESDSMVTTGWRNSLFFRRGKFHKLTYSRWSVMWVIIQIISHPGRNVTCVCTVLTVCTPRFSCHASMLQARWEWDPSQRTLVSHSASTGSQMSSLLLRWCYLEHLIKTWHTQTHYRAF